MRQVYHLAICISFFLVHATCKKEVQTIPSPLHPVELKYPTYFPLPNDFEFPLTVEGIALGRRLYYDTLLSNTGHSCASCHVQQQGFSENSQNALPHVNLAWNRYFLWNGKIQGSLEEAMRFEVHTFFATDVSKLSRDPIYPTQFEKVFGSKTIHSEQVAIALAQFIRTLVSQNNRIDQYLRHELMLNDDELRGLYIFNSERGDCFHCHSLGLFTDGMFHNNGIDSIFQSANLGRYAVSGLAQDLGKFKTPTLRNVAQTSPYMHDGRFKTLEEVIEFYNSGVRFSSTLDPIMTKSSFANGLNLNQQEKLDLLAFLKALSDSTYLHQADFSAP